MTKEEFATMHLNRLGHKHPTDSAIRAIVQAIDTDKWVHQMYERECKREEEGEI